MHLVLGITIVLMAILFYIGFMLLFEDKHRSKESVAVDNAFKRVIKRHRLSISDVDVVGSSIIALDKKTGKLVLVVYKNGVTWEKCFSLNQLLFCQIVNVQDKISLCIKSIKLELTFSNDSRVISFVFFDEKTDNLSDLPSRVKKSKYWKRKIQYQISCNQLEPLLC